MLGVLLVGLLSVAVALSPAEQQLLRSVAYTAAPPTASASRTGQYVYPKLLDDGRTNGVVRVRVGLGPKNVHELELVATLAPVRDNYTVRVVRPDGSEELTLGSKPCYFLGKVNGDESSRASITYCMDGRRLHGFYTYRGSRFSVSPADLDGSTASVFTSLASSSGSPSLALHLVHRELGIETSSSSFTSPSSRVVDTVRADAADGDMQGTMPPIADASGSGSSSPPSAADSGIPAAAQQGPATVAVLVVADSSMTDVYGSTTAAWVTSVVVGAAGLYNNGDTGGLFYPSVNLEVAGVEVWQRDNVPVSSNGPQTLVNFCRWASENRYSQGDYDVAMLVTYRNLKAQTVDIVGIAYVGTACTNGGCALVEDLGARSQAGTVQTIAHETGHTLGANHDGTDNSCPANEFIMSAIQSSTTEWSSCSGSQITSFVNARFLSEAFCATRPVDLSQGITTNSGAATLSVSLHLVFALLVAARTAFGSPWF